MTALSHPSLSDLEDLGNVLRLPSADCSRPHACPDCQAAAGYPGAWNLIGHGTYSRRVRLGGGRAVTIRVRRFLCLACGHTTSLLPDSVYPRRHYAGTAILVALVHALLLRVSPAQVRKMFCSSSVPAMRGWRALGRWRQQLLRELWPWWSRQLGFRDGPPLGDTAAQSRALRRLLAQGGVHESSTPSQLESAARALMFRTVHAQGETPVMQLAF